MEGGKKSGSSFTSDLFGAKDSSAAAPSSGIFGSIFAPPARVSGGESLNFSVAEKKNDSVSQARSAKTAVSGSFSDNNAQGGQEQNWSTTSKDMKYYQDEKVQPFHYSSSIYYGGQDIYSQPESAKNPGVTTFNKDVGEDDSGSASRGNWWQGMMLLSLLDGMSPNVVA
ncbi:hypothetical protein Pfo_004391 [Paulownia fortunei]|nr:hypothetical protein Pfo_004391 [Paulownia fortunei]